MDKTNGLSFEIYVMELCESYKPKKAEDLEKLSDELHQRIENAIADYISDQSLNGEYESQY